MTIAPMGTGQNRDVLFYDPEAEAKVKQMRKAAELMRENAKMGAPNEMAGRVVYKKSPFEYLAKMGSSLIAGNEERKAEESDAAYKKRRSEILAQAVQGYGEDNGGQMARILMQDPSMMSAGIGIMSDAQKMKLEQEKLQKEQELIAAGYMPGKDFQSQLYNRLLPSMGVSGAANAASAMQTFTGPDGAIYRAPSRNVPQIGSGVPQQGFGLGGQSLPNDGQVSVPNPPNPQQMAAQVPEVSANQPDALGNTIDAIGKMNLPVVTPNDGTMVIPGKTHEQKVAEAANIEAEKAKASVLGKTEGENLALLQSMNANLPKLLMVTKDLSDLGKMATYTKAGQFYDILRKEFGAETRPEAVARSKYIAMIDNNILPLLRETFGAQFTQKEGDSLKITLGDPDKTPEEKDAVLSAFITNKKREIESMNRRLGVSPSLESSTQTGQMLQTPDAAQAPANVIRWEDLP